ncbi:mxaC protein [Methylobacter tundripaludum]|uniref:MxaC protein n=1 Tax=Methylobacter tundripaludum TaxID=173365 RepID=A0A2S6HEQ9_9GAMM|nr:vWA domain-containing protein [Methylobacter tundripaludum]PPK75965.1 mxaC protein [Methylobacter tundripaludum]
MNLAVNTPWALAGLVLTLLPLFNNGMRTSPAPWTALIPGDTLSVFIVCCLRLCAVAAIAGLVLGIAGLHRAEQSRERIGHGAHIVLLLDRSSSMDNTFAGRASNGSDESKATAARRLLTDFVKQRQTDLIGVAEYSTSPLFVMPLTENKNAVQAAIAATATPALGFTHVSKGLGMAISFFEQQPVTGSRIVLLVSDGAAAIDHDSEQKLRLWFKQQQVRLYWIFLRTAGSPGIFDQPEDSRDDNAQAMPERYLHKFFLGLGSPYQAYEAESPDALKQAIADINQLENLPMHYVERIPKQDLSAVCYSVAAFLLLVLFGVKFCEVKR